MNNEDERPIVDAMKIKEVNSYHDYYWFADCPYCNVKNRIEDNKRGYYFCGNKNCGNLFYLR